MYKQEPPFAMQIELSEGCNLYCDFCGLQGIRTIKEKNFKFMTLETARRIANQVGELGWNPRIEFAMHGEPTMNPDYIQVVKRFRKALPRHHIMMTSNGGGLLRPPGIVPSLEQLFDVGLNVFAFDAYEYVKIKDKIDAVLFGDEAFGQNGEQRFEFDVHRYPDEKEFSPHNRYGHDARLFIRVQDISKAEKGTHSHLNNHCGAGGPALKQPIVARCAKPFRELSIRWNGDVAICCNDWRGEFKVGNVVEGELENVWQHPRLMAARRFLMQGDRASVKPCNVCDAKSYRVGLLPDKKGQKKMRKPSLHDDNLVAAAERGKPLATVVIRPWEIKGRKHVQS